MKRPPIDRYQRVLSIHNLKMAIMSSTGCVLAFESAIFGQFQAQEAGDVAGRRSLKLTKNGTFEGQNAIQHLT